MMDTTLFSSAVLCALAGVTWARPQLGTGPSATAPSDPAPVPAPFTAARLVPITQQHIEQAPDGQYRWNYATADGASQEAVGVLKGPASSIAVQGSYAYQSPEGQYQVNYIADEFGFQPTGTHIHPAILEAVRRQVEFARSEPANYYDDAGFPVNEAGAAVGTVAPAPPVDPSGPALF